MQAGSLNLLADTPDAPYAALDHVGRPLREDGLALMGSVGFHFLILAVAILLSKWSLDGSPDSPPAGSGTVVAFVTLADDPSGSGSKKSLETQSDASVSLPAVAQDHQADLSPAAETGKTERPLEIFEGSVKIPASTKSSVKSPTPKSKAVTKDTAPAAVPLEMALPNSAKDSLQRQPQPQDAAAGEGNDVTAHQTMIGAAAEGSPSSTTGTAVQSSGASSAQDGPPVITNAKFRKTPRPPAYPPRAQELRQEGISVVRALIDTDGTSRDIRLWRSSGFDQLDRAAIAAVRDWDFEAARIGNQPILAWVEIPVHFTIK